ncbi:hypothetical protein ACSBR1_006705 [Camellia fascicularis]
MQANLEESELTLIEEIGAKVSEDFSGKIKLNDQIEKSAPSDEEFEDEDHDDDDEEEFSFACIGTDGWPISADDAFQNGQIKPVFPLFDQRLLQGSDSDDLPRRSPKVFVGTEESEPAEPAGPYCNWTGKAVEASAEACKKSNSTGFSKFWRFRELVNRSSSDGRDAFVFLNKDSNGANLKKSDGSSEKKIGAGETKVAGGKGKVVKKGKKTASLSPHEMHYVKNRAWREEDRRRSYLPYRPEVFGFFTSVHGGLSKNVHPF